MITEHDRIWIEAHRASQADEYFKERPFFNDQTYRRVFDAAFQLGWELQRTEIDVLKDALTWYAEMAKAAQTATMNIDNQFALRVLKEMALDGGKRAAKVLKG